MERTRGVADVSSMHMVLNNQISLKLMTSMLAVILVPYPAIHTSGVYCIKNNAIITETGCSCGHSHLTYVNSSVIVVSVYLPAYAHILYSQIQHASGIDISQGNGLGWNLDTLMYYFDSFPCRKICTIDYKEQEGTVTNQRACIYRLCQR